MKNLRHLIWLVSFLSPWVAAEQNKIILCEKSDCYSTYDKLILEKKPLKASTEYSTGYGFFIDIPNGFKKLKEVDNGLVFQYEGQEKWIMLLSPTWNYEHVRVADGHDSGYVFRGENGLEVVMVAYKNQDDISYEAYITYQNMPDNKIYIISSLGINKTTFKSLISSIKFHPK